MDFLSNLFPPILSLELDPTNPLQNVTFLQNAFIATFLTSLGVEIVKDILGESVRLTYSTQPSFVINEKAKTNLK